MKTIELGNIVRAYDFEPAPGRGDSFVEGKVIAAMPNWILVTVTRDVWAGEETPNEITKTSRVGQHIQTPLETISEWDGRLTIIEEDN